MMFRATIFFLMLAATRVAAQAPIAIQSGEHATFTRLVLTIDPNRPWSLVPGDNVWAFQLPGAGVDFDITDVFTRIPKSRLGEVEVRKGDSESALILHLSCQCGVTASGYQGRYVILDIAEMTESELAEITSTVATPNNAVATRSSPELFRQNLDSTPPMIAEINISSMLAPMMGTASAQDPPDRVDERAQLMAESIIYAPESAHFTDAQSEIAPIDDATKLRVSEAQTALMEQLTRAAEQGIVNFVAQEPDPVTPAEPEPIAEAVLIEAIEPALGPQISATTVYDRDGSSALADIVHIFARTHCIEDPDLGVALWGGEGNFGEEMSRLHAAMVEERDRPLPEATKDLVRFYIRYGLGREALTLLNAYDLAPEAPALFELAQIADDQTPAPGGVMDKGQGCGGAHEMWRLIGQAENAEPPNAQADSILAAFAELPIDLRSQIAPKLGWAFIYRNQPDMAARVIELAERSGWPASDALRLLQAQLAMAVDFNLAETSLAVLVTENSENAPQAMLLWADSLRNRHTAAPEPLIQSLAAAAFELRGTELGRSLRLAEIYARAGAEGFDFALDLIVRDLGRDPLADLDLRFIAAEILREAVPNLAAPSGYAETILRHQGLVPEGRDGDSLRVILAENLLALAMPDLALSILQAAPEHDEAAQRVAAQALLARFEPEAVIALLAERDDALALELIAAAYAQLGDYAAALDALTRSGTHPEPRSDVAFLAGAWTQVDDAAPESEVQLARYMAMRETVSSAADTGVMHAPDTISLSPLPIDQPNTLEAARATLEANRASREYLEALLNPPEAPLQ